MTILGKIDNYTQQGKSFALVTVVESKGSTPREIGAKMIVFADGSIEGTVGGGGIEYKAIGDALYYIRHNMSGLREYILTKKYDSLCGGSMKIFIEAFNPEKKLIIVGAGHIGLALYKFAKILGFKITVIDNRREFAKITRFPKAEKIIVGKPHKMIKKIKIDEDTYIVIVTHSHRHDYDVLKEVANSQAKYIGMIGSSKKVKDVFNRLIDEGIKANVLRNVHAPLGLNLGGDSPEEIAISILSEIISVYNNSRGSLRFRKIVGEA